MGLNGTCNATLDDLRIGGSEQHLVGDFTFHSLGLIISAACTLIAVLLSFFLIWMHALHYTKPWEQRHIIRILFMIPVYAVASFLSFWFYWHSIYFEVISDCYEAFAIASFFALLCHYIAPTLHEQKAYFRGIQPKGWVWPMSTMKKCCGGERGPWRTPRSGLTWFNICWTGIYQYCFIRVTMTVTAVLTQYFGRYCESSNSPLFAHIWIEVIEATAVTVAMYCVIQFYIQLRQDLAPYRPFLKVVAIKLVIFLSFWQSFLISILTSSTLKIVSPTAKIAYPDLKVGIPSLLLCIEMAIFSVLHLFAFPYKPYSQGLVHGTYPVSTPSAGQKLNELGPNQGGILGVSALIDAMNPWDLVKGFARGMRWLFVGRRNRENDASYKVTSFDINNPGGDNDVSLGPTGLVAGSKGTQELPIADEFRRSRFGMPGKTTADEERAGLVAHAQPNPLNPGGSGYVPAKHRYDANGHDISVGGNRYESHSPYEQSPDRIAGRNPTPGLRGMQQEEENIGMAISGEPEPYRSQVQQQQYGIAVSEPEPYHSQVSQPQYHAYPQQSSGGSFLEQKRDERRQQQAPSEQWANATQRRDESPPEIHNALWGPEARRDEGGQF